MADPVGAVAPDPGRSVVARRGRTSRPRPAGRAKNAVSNTATCGHVRVGRPGLRMPSSGRAGCAAARGARRRRSDARPSSSTSVGATSPGPPWTTRWPTARSPPGPIPAAATRSATSVRAAPKPSVPIRSRWPSRTDAPRVGSSTSNFSEDEPALQHEHEGRGHDAPCRRWAATVARRQRATPERSGPADPGRRTLPRTPWPGEPRSREPHRSGARRRPARRRQRGRHPTAGPGGHRRDHRAARAHVRGQPQAAVLHGQPLGGAGLRQAPRRATAVRARPGGRSGTRRLVALGTAEPLGADVAEVAFLVDDTLHGLGLGTLLLEHLAAAGRDRGLRRFVAEILAENSAMIGVFLDAGFALSRQTRDGALHVEMDTAASAAAVDAADERECRAEASSLRPLLYPGSVAVVGVRRDGTGVGAAVLRSIVDGGFTGTVHAVHPTADEIAGRPRPTAAGRRPGRVDLVVVAVPATRVLATLEDAADAGVPAAVVLSSGFEELGEEGAAMQRAMLDLARRRSIRIIGPNCLGLMSNLPEVSLNATFSGAVPPPGRPGGGLPVRRSRHRAHRRGPPARARGRVLRLAGEQGGRLQQRPPRGLAGRPAGERRGPLPGVVRQRLEVRPLRPPVRRAQAPAGRGRRAVRRGTAGGRVAHRRRGVPVGGRRRAVRPGRRGRLRGRGGPRGDRPAAGRPAPARRAARSAC